MAAILPFVFHKFYSPPSKRFNRSVGLRGGRVGKRKSPDTFVIPAKFKSIKKSKTSRKLDFDSSQKIEMSSSSSSKKRKVSSGGSSGLKAIVGLDNARKVIAIGKRTVLKGTKLSPLFRTSDTGIVAEDTDIIGALLRSLQGQKGVNVLPMQATAAKMNWLCNMTMKNRPGIAFGNVTTGGVNPQPQPFVNGYDPSRWLGTNGQFGTLGAYGYQILGKSKLVVNMTTKFSITNLGNTLCNVKLHWVTVKNTNVYSADTRFTAGNLATDITNSENDLPTININSGYPDSSRVVVPANLHLSVYHDFRRSMVIKDKYHVKTCATFQLKPGAHLELVVKLPTQYVSFEDLACFATNSDSGARTFGGCFVFETHGPVVAEMLRSGSPAVDTYQNLTRAPTAIGVLNENIYYCQCKLLTSSQKTVYGNQLANDLDNSLGVDHHLQQINVENDQEEFVHMP